MLDTGNDMIDVSEPEQQEHKPDWDLILHHNRGTIENKNHYFLLLLHEWKI